MKRLILATATLALAFPLAACGPEAPPASAGTSAPAPAPSATPAPEKPVADFFAKLAELEAKYIAAKGFVGLFLPFVSADRAAQIHDIERGIDVAFAAARVTRVLSEQDKDDVLDRIERAIAELER